MKKSAAHAPASKKTTSKKTSSAQVVTPITNDVAQPNTPSTLIPPSQPPSVAPPQPTTAQPAIQPPSTPSAIPSAEAILAQDTANPVLSSVPTNLVTEDDEKIARRDFFIFLAGLGIFILILGVSGFFIQQHLAKSAQLTATPSPTPIAETPAPSPSPVAIDKATVTVSVLNASGVPGAAKKIVTALEKLGYKNVTGGNNDTNETASTIRIPTMYGEALEFQADAKTAGVKTFTTSPSTSSNIEIILGK